VVAASRSAVSARDAMWPPRTDAARFAVPDHHLCLPADDAGRGHLFLLCTKPRRERWIVRAVRRACFPVIAALARRGVTPSQVTWASLAVAVVGALALAFAGYPGGIAGAALLAASRWLDTLDGALARLTHAASPAGARLDTAAGRIANILTALALGWAGFAARGAWRDGLVAIAVLLVGGVLATLASHRADRVPPAHHPAGLARARAVIEHALNREYTLGLLILAIADDLAAFVWLAAAVAYLSCAIDVTLVAVAERNAVRRSTR
jgi:phosphatidylglycerophosphate synthase